MLMIKRSVGYCGANVPECKHIKLSVRLRQLLCTVTSISLEKSISPKNFTFLSNSYIYKLDSEDVNLFWGFNAFGGIIVRAS